jgi:hypothetical protein
VSQPPYGQPQYGQPEWQQQPDPTLRAPVDPYYSPGGQQPGYEQQQPGYDQPSYPSSPAYPSYGDPNSGYADPNSGYADPVSAYPGTQSYQPSPGYGTQGYQQPQSSPPYYQPPQQQPQPGYGGPGYPGSPGYPPTPSGGGGGRGVVVVLVIFLALIVVGGGIGAFVLLGNKSDKPSAHGSGGASAGTTTSAGPTAASPTPAGHQGDLRTFLIDAPSGSHNWPTPLGSDRNLSIDQAADLSSDSKGRKDMLNQYTFTHGAVQCWIGSDRSVVDVRLYQFDSADHAESFFRDDIDATSSDYTAATTATIPSVPGAEAYSDPKKDDQGYVHVIAIGIKADVVFVVSLGEHSDTVDLTLPDRLMQQQYNKL